MSYVATSTVRQSPADRPACRRHADGSNVADYGCLDIKIGGQENSERTKYKVV